MLDANREDLVLGIVGAGLMGRGIAQIAALAGIEVLMFDLRAGAAEEAKAALEQTLSMLEGKGKLSADERAAAVARIVPAAALGEFARCHVVVEAIIENLDAKRALFRQLEEVVGDDCLLASNTSSLAVTAIAAACRLPERVAGFHFFSPVPLMKIVEVIEGVLSAPWVGETLTALARRMGHTPVRAKDTPGFIVNHAGRGFLTEALRIVGEGIADFPTVDRILRNAVGFRLGPFELLDLTGLDVNLASSISVYKAFFEEPRYRPHPLQQRMVDAGWLGRKVGRGFYLYDERGVRTGPEPQPAHPDRPASRTTEDAGATFDVIEDAGATFEVIGEGPVASLLRSRLPAPAGGGRPDVTFDTRLDAPDTAGGAQQADVVAVLAWGRSASSANGAVRQTAHADATAGSQHPTVLGFSLVPGAPAADETLAIELLVPAAPGAASTARAVGAALTRAGVTVVTLPDQPGGIAFRIVALLINEAVGALAEGLAEAADIDRALRLGVNYPLGPLEWAERLGPAAVLGALDSLHREIGAERFAPHPLLRAMVALGLGSFAEFTAHEAAPGAAGSGRMGR